MHEIRETEDLRSLAGPLVERIRLRAHTLADRTALTVLGDGSASEIQLTYAQLDESARALAARLQRSGAVGERVLIIQAPGADYVISLLACFYAGAVAVPAYPPRRRNAERLLGMIADCDAKLIIADGATRTWLPAQIDAAFPQREPLQWISPEDLDLSLASSWRAVPPSPGAPCLLQYTSGSTSAPKGVVLTQDNFIANVDALLERVGYRSDDCYVCWLPPFHDMGLVSGILAPLCHGVPTVLLTPIAFQRRPMKWLEAISRFRATVSGGPNFGYELCVRRAAAPDKLAALNLSQWRVAFTGAERVRAETLERFARVMQPAGFHERALTPCYGLAESTVAVTFGKAGKGWQTLSLDEVALGQGRVELARQDRPSVRLVGCGPALAGCDLLIVDPGNRHRLDERQIGEIWLSSASVGAGYWGKPDLGERSFRARLAPANPDTQTDTSTGAQCYLRTGDLGFMHEGELFVAGRIKDLVILRGANHFPEDIEASVRLGLPPDAAGGCAAFSVERDGAESLVVVQELESALHEAAPSLREAMRESVAQRNEIAVDDIVFVPTGAIPRTSSGKIQRSACREMYASTQFVAVPEKADAADQAPLSPAPAQDVVAKIASIMATLLDVPAVAPDDDFFWMGGHSLLATQLVSRLRLSFAVDVTLRTIFDGATPQKLAARLATLPRISQLQPVAVAEPGTAPMLSFSQERMWLLHQLDPSSAAYNVGGGLVIEGDLDVRALQRAFECVALRHEMLRATFPAHDGAPTVTIAPALAVPIAQFDVSTEPDPMASARLAGEALLHRPFDIAGEPLLRLGLWRLAPQRHLLAASLHHLITDAWSVGLLLSDALTYYDELVAGREPVVEPPPYAYTDFARWQREQMSGERLSQELDWWSKRLEGASPVEIPTDHPRAARRSSDGAYLPMELPPGLLDALATIGVAQGTTLFMVLLTAFEVLLARYTGSDDLVVGIPVANRNELASESMMGSLVNTLALRVPVQPDQPFSALLQTVREIAIDGYTHQDLPFERLVSSMRLERRPGESPLVNALFDFQNAPVPGRDCGPLRVRPMHLCRGAAQFDLNLLVMDTELGRLAGIEYRTELFDASTMRRLLRHYLIILEQIVADPSTTVERFVLVDATECEEQLALAAPTRTPASTMPSVPQCIRALALSQPQSIALVDDAGPLSYAQLDEQSDNWAARLAHLGARPGERVGVLMERGRDLVIALLATLKTGAAYIPLDPRFPADRIEYVLADAQPRVVITRPQWQAVAGSLHHCSCVLYEDSGLAGTQSRPPALPVVGLDHAAYVIYTSGSTGRPKGVEVGMAALGNFLGSMAHTPGLDAHDRVLAITTVAFDIAGLEIWLPLVRGASVRIVTEDTSTDPLALMQCMQSWQPTLMQATPATWKMLLAADWAGDPDLKILCGGEAMAPDLAQALIPRCASLWNMYGPTETTVWSSLHQVQEKDSARVPIGRPIDRTRLYVLDRLGQLQVRGVTGELAIGGDGVAMGYFHRPELTAERFVPDPYARKPGARMYRTGDGARLRADGTFECLARMDDQIKLRGFRIEPGEIEAVLKEDPDVTDAVVIAHGHPPDDARLVAYYVARNGLDTLEERLFSTLSRRLPDYMVPAALVRLDRLPQTPNGKIDRRALPAPEFGKLPSGAEFVAPRDEIEATLAGIWQELLEVPQVGVRDNFFRLGGYSLLAMRVLARIRQQLGVTLAPAVLIERPTIEHLADEIRSHRSHGAQAREAMSVEAAVPYHYLVPFGERNVPAPLICIHGAGGNVYNFSALAERMGQGHALLGVQARGVNGMDTPFERIEEMAAAYLQEIRSAQPDGPYFLAGYCGGGVVAYEMACQLRRAGQEVPLLVLIDCYRPGLNVQGPSRARRWFDGLKTGGARYLADKTSGWLRRNGHILRVRATIALHTLVGRPVPFELRDHWLTSAFLNSTRHFSPSVYPGELTLLRARDVDSELASVGPDLGWQGLAAEIKTFDVPGNHFTLLDQPNVDALAATLRSRLDRAQAGKAST